MISVVTFPVHHAIVYQTILTVDVINVHPNVPAVSLFIGKLQSNRKLSPFVSFSESLFLLISTNFNQYRIEPLLPINIHERMDRQISHISLIYFTNSTHNISFHTSPKRERFKLSSNFHQGSSKKTPPTCEKKTTLQGTNTLSKL